MAFPLTKYAHHLMAVLRSWPVILAGVFVFVVDVFDSFGFDTAADEQASAVSSVAAGPFYGLPSRIGQRSILVVQIDQASLDFLHQAAPLPYVDQADLVTTVAGYEPAAILMDFSYDRPHGDDAPDQINMFAERLKAASSYGGPPIMIGAVSDDPLLAPLRQLQSVGVQWVDTGWFSYPMRDSAGKEMAASALYRAWCARSHACHGWTPPWREKLSLNWGYGGSNVTGTTPRNCQLSSPDTLGRLKAATYNLVEELLRGIFYEPNRTMRCIYTDTINAATLQQTDAESLRALIKDRVVLIGGSYKSSGDLQAIPNMGVVPGVYVHAMALDNLIQLGRDYRRPPPTLFASYDAADAVESGLTLALFLLMLSMRHVNTSAGDNERGFVSKFAFGSAGYLVIGGGLVVLAVLAENYMHWPPLNIMGVIVLMFAVFEYMRVR